MEAEQEREQDTDQTIPDETPTVHRVSFLQRVDLPFLASALIASFVVLLNDPWWTVQTLESSSLLSVQISPYYVQINAIGAPATFPFAIVLGTATRIILGVTAIALALEGFFPKSVWRKPVFWLGLSSFVELYLSFTLMLHSAQLALLSMYGMIPPVSGDTIIPGTVLGTDLSPYLSPRITSSFATPFFIGLACIGVLGGSELFHFIHRQKKGFMAFDFMRGLGAVFLSPPYQHAWFTSSDQSFNPLNQDPDNLTDDELAMSFERLEETIRPGGIISIILPAWAGQIANRLAKLVPWTGFRLERSELIYRVQGQPEYQLFFRKPAIVQKPASEPQEVQLQAENLETVPTEKGAPSLMEESPVEDAEKPPIAEAVEDPDWARPQMTLLETAIIRSAVSTVERHGEPVPHRELVNDVYMDLLNRGIGFESVGQIETILLDHHEKELALIEELDETGAFILRKWWLGDTVVPAKTEKSVRLRRRLSTAKKGIPKVSELLKRLKPKRTGYVQKKQRVDDD